MVTLPGWSPFSWDTSFQLHIQHRGIEKGVGGLLKRSWNGVGGLLFSSTAWQRAVGSGQVRHLAGT